GMGNKEQAIASYGVLLSIAPSNLDPRLLGLAQLAALYEEQEDWEKALGVYVQIERSHGRPRWVRAAAKRKKEIQAYLRERKKTQGVSVQAPSTDKPADQKPSSDAAMIQEVFAANKIEPK